jgi:hypothetical protein
MTAEHKRIDDFNNVRCPFGIHLVDEIQNFDFDYSLCIILGLIFYHLECDDLLELVIKGLEHLPKRTLAQQVLNLISIGNVVMIKNLHFPFLIVKVILIIRWLLPSLTNTVYHLVMQNLVFFVWRELIAVFVHTITP